MTQILRVAAGLVAVGLCLPLTACSSSAGDITCADSNNLSISKQSDVLRDMLDEHDLRQYDTGNISGITSNVTSYCASGKHSRDPINKAVDWDSNQW